MELDQQPRSVRLLALLRGVMRAQSAEGVGLVASGAAFWLVLAVFPAAIAAISVYGLVVNPKDVADSLAGLASHGPQSLGSGLSQQLQRVASTDRVGLTVGLVVSVVLALWSASAGVYNLERAIRTAYGLRPDEYVRARGRALVGAVLVILGLGAIALLSTTIAVVVDRLPVLVVVLVGIPLLVVVVAAVNALLYRYAVGSEVRMRRVLPGSVAASIGLGVVIAGFGVYLHSSARYTAVYGALAGTVIGMMGTYLGVYVLLLGAVLNVELERPTAPGPDAMDGTAR